MLLSTSNGVLPVQGSTFLNVSDSSSYVIRVDGPERCLTKERFGDRSFSNGLGSVMKKVRGTVTKDEVSVQDSEIFVCGKSLLLCFLALLNPIFVVLTIS